MGAAESVRLKVMMVVEEEGRLTLVVLVGDHKIVMI